MGETAGMVNSGLLDYCGKCVEIKEVSDTATTIHQLTSSKVVAVFRSLLNTNISASLAGNLPLARHLCLSHVTSESIGQYQSSLKDILKIISLELCEIRFFCRHL